VIAVHLIFTLYGHWAVNDPRGSGSSDFIDLKFAPLGPIDFGRKPAREQPTRKELKEFHEQHEELLNFPILWIDDAKAQAIAEAIRDVLREHGYTCYACAICGNHIHLVIRTHKHDSVTIWNHIAERIRQRLRLRFPQEISAHHPVISARPYKVFLYTPDEVWDRIVYVEENPLKENLPAQRWDFVAPYDNFPLHKGLDAKALAEAKVQAIRRAREKRRARRDR
jgi:REP element-mobilizing transposase RayT